MAITVDVKIDLEQVHTQDLIDEAKSRPDYMGELAILDIVDMIDALRDAECPAEIIDALEEWQRGPVPDESMLRMWRTFCGVAV